MPGPVRRILPVLLGLAVLLLTVPTAPACPFCATNDKTLTAEMGEATIVVYGAPKTEEKATTSELVIETVIIDKEGTLTGRKTIPLNRFVPPELVGKNKLLIFCDVFQGKIDPYRGIPVAADSVMPKYLQGALAIKNRKQVERLRYFFDYLDNADVEISVDAFREFGRADWKDTHDLMHRLPDEEPAAVEKRLAKAAAWLGDRQTPAFRYGLYGSMLGYGGETKYAPVLKALLDDPERKVASSIDGVLAGYLMLEPKEGLARVRAVLSNPKGDFGVRYAALRAVRFLYDYQPTKDISRDTAVQVVALLLKQSDMADLAIEDLRKWQRWDMADEIMALHKVKEIDEVPINHRAMIRFALSCPSSNACAGFLAAERTADPAAVKEAEELLRLEPKPK